MFRPVDSKLDVPKLEHEVIERWRERDTMVRYLARNAESERRYSFLDGPITANNPMGVHHAWGRTYKDLFQRYHTMLGERQRYQNGFDCQGLWIEVEVEKELGFNNKRQIESFGIDRFVELCKQRVDRFAALISEQSRRLGIWMNWDDSYYTNSDENNYTIWAFLAECHRQGLLYRGHDVMPWCPRCGTGISNMEAAEGYREVKHLSVTLRLPITSAGREGEDLLVWTTTPWTLSSNVAAAVHPDLTYQLVEGRDGRRWWVSAGSKARVAGDAPVIREALGAELVDLTYTGPFDELPAAAGVAHRVIPWNEVDDAEGTGIVHIAPGCGQEDFALAKTFDLPVIDPIDEFGVFVDGFGWQTGRVAGATDDPSTDIARDVVADLERKGLLVATEQYTHSYPHCWRCGTQLIFRLVDEWFIAMDPLRAPVSDSTRDVTWLPPGIGLEERELDWLRNMGDWMISKKRYYGLALPIWECTDCEAWEVIGSKGELRERAVAGWDEFDGHTPHRPWVDAVEIACTSCGGRARRTTDVGNPWLDAGIVGLSTLGWNTDRDEWAQWYPADWISESFPGQFRNWFYALLTMSTVMTGRAPMRTLFAYALDARRARRGDAQEQGQLDLVRRRGRADRRRRDALDVRRHEPLDEPELRPRPGPRGGSSLLPAAVEHVRLLRHLRQPRRLDAGPDRWRGGVPDDPRPMDPVAPRRADRRGSRGPRRATTRCARLGRSRASSTSCPTGTCAATDDASGRGSSTPTSAPRYTTLHEVLTTLMRSDGADHPAPGRRDLGEPRRGGRSGTGRQRAPDRYARACRRPSAAGARGRRRPCTPDRGARARRARCLRHPDASAAPRSPASSCRRPPAERSRPIRTWPRP